MKHTLTLISTLLLAFVSHAVAAISVTEFGAKGDGIADDTRAIQAALDTGKNVVIREGTFRISNALSPKANQVIELIGTVRIADSIIQRVTSDAAAGQPNVTVADASGYYAGQWVTMGADDLPMQGGGGGVHKDRREGGDCGRIASIAGNTITFELPLRRAYKLAANPRLGTQPSAFLVTQPGVRIHGTGVIDGNRAKQFDFAPGDMTPKQGRGEDTRAGCGISIDSQLEPVAHTRIEGITIRDCILHNLSLYNTQHTLISLVTCIRARQKHRPETQRVLPAHRQPVPRLRVRGRDHHLLQQQPLRRAGQHLRPQRARWHRRQRLPNRHPALRQHLQGQWSEPHAARRLLLVYRRLLFRHRRRGHSRARQSGQRSHRSLRRGHLRHRPQLHRRHHQRQRGNAFESRHDHRPHER